MHRTVFHASCAILCPVKGIFYCRPVFLNTANRHQELWYGLRRALRRERACPGATTTMVEAVEYRRALADLPSDAIDRSRILHAPTSSAMGTRINLLDKAKSATNVFSFGVFLPGILVRGGCVFQEC